MKHLHTLILTLAVLPALLSAASCSSSGKGGYQSTKEERNLIKAGNREFADSNFIASMQRYAEAQTAAPGSEPARYNHTRAMSAFAGTQDDKQRDSIRANAGRVYDGIIQFANDSSLRQKSAFNMGNMAFRAQQYPASIDYYKEALRIDPYDQKARENLLVALIMNQQQQDQNQDQQEQQEQQQQEQEQQQEQQEQPQPQQPQQQKDMSANAEQILQTMQNRENKTRQEAKEVPAAAPRTTDKPW